MTNTVMTTIILQNKPTDCSAVRLRFHKPDRVIIGRNASSGCLVLCYMKYCMLNYFFSISLKLTVTDIICWQTVHLTQNTEFLNRSHSVPFCAVKNIMGFNVPVGLPLTVINYQYRLFSKPPVTHALIQSTSCDSFNQPHVTHTLIQSTSCDSRPHSINLL